MGKQPANQFVNQSAHTENGDSRYTHHPWRALLLMLGLAPVGYSLAALVLYGNPGFSQWYRSPAVPMLGNILAYVVAPFFLRIPKGKRTFRQYLDDLRLTKTQPFFRLLVLTLSCVFILISDYVVTTFLM